MPNSGAKQRLVYFGNERLATGVTTDAPVLQMLLSEGYDVCAVVVHHTETRSRNARELEVASIAKAHDIPLISPDRPAEIISDITAFGAVAGVLVAYGRIIPNSFIDLFPMGIINVHPSLLPKHRGPTPIESSILAGDSVTGVSIMKISSKMDAGPVYAQSQVGLTGHETKQELVNTLGSTAAEMLRELLPEILSGALAPKAQEDSQATYDQLIEKQSGTIDTTKPATVLEREIRAFAGWPGSRLQISNMDVVITKATIAEAAPENHGQKTIFVSNKQLYIQTGDGLLHVQTLKPAGKSEMTAQAFLAGHAKLL